jgi:hypothetical protein
MTVRCQRGGCRSTRRAIVAPHESGTVELAPTRRRIGPRQPVERARAVEHTKSAYRALEGSGYGTRRFINARGTRTARARTRAPGVRIVSRQVFFTSAPRCAATRPARETVAPRAVTRLGPSEHRGGHRGSGGAHAPGPHLIRRALSGRDVPRQSRHQNKRLWTLTQPWTHRTRPPLLGNLAEEREIPTSVHKPISFLLQKKRTKNTYDDSCRDVRVSSERADSDGTNNTTRVNMPPPANVRRTSRLLL